jgi:sugar phosphate isomerase/epimerase
MKQTRSTVATSRRGFIRALGSAAAAGLFATDDAPSQTPAPAQPLKISIFSKHLQWLDYHGMAQTAAEIGFDGIDLTVREGGHVLPERVQEDLPKAFEEVRKAGLIMPMVTAGIVTAHTSHADAMLKTIGSLGIPFYRWGGFQWDEPTPVPQRLAQIKEEAARLAELNRRYNVCAMYHNHSGTEVGASVWDLWIILKDLDKTRLGVNYDVSHATIEGGLGAWINGLRLISPWLKGIAIKDFYWGKNAKGEWKAQFCPLGEGMVNFKRYFQMLKQANFSGPVQLHVEYPLGGAESGARSLTIDKSKVVEAMRKDLTTLRAWLREASLA